MTRNVRLDSKSRWSPFSPLLILLVGAGCASTPQVAPKETEELEMARRQVQELRDQVTNLNGRLEGMELQVSSLQDQLKASRTSIETLSRKGSSGDVTEVLPAASENLGRPIGTAKAPSDPDAGFITDAAVDAYRGARALFDARKYPESMLAFTSFLEQYADHPWAGSAQFHVGQSYFFQKECKLALQEFQRVLTSYDRSPHVAETLRQMALCEDELKMTAAATRHRQLLASLFPSSPAAADLVAGATGATSTNAAPPAAGTQQEPASAGSIPPTAPAEGTTKQ